MMGIIASIPFWILGIAAFIGAVWSINWNQEITDQDAAKLLAGFIAASVLFFIAVKIAS